MSVSITEIGNVLQPGMAAAGQKFSDLINHFNPNDPKSLYELQQASAEFQMFIESSSQLMKSAKDTGEAVIRNI